MNKQATLAEYRANTPTWPFDHYGPTRRRPVPPAEAERSALAGWLHHHGFNLACIREAEGTCHLGPDDTHPADERWSWEIGPTYEVFGNAGLEDTEPIRTDLARVRQNEMELAL